MRNKLALGLVTVGTVLLILVVFAPQLQSALQAIWNSGDVFIGDAKGHYLVYSNGGTFKETLDNGVSGYAAGCEFNNDFSQLYTTAFSAGQIVKFASTDPHARSSFGTPGQPNPESIVFKANGGFFVGGPRSATILEYDASDNLITTYAVAPTDTTHGTDWIELSSNQTTLFYTGEGRVIKRYDTTAGQLADFARLPGSGAAYALRLLPPFDGTGGLIVADRYDVKRLDGNGNVIQSYSVPNISNAFSALNLDPDGTTFWAGSHGVLYRFNIAAGGGPIQMIDVPGAIAGVCLKAGPTPTPTPPPCGVVTTTADTGAGSLRAVLTCANNSVPLDTITFNIPSSDPGCHNVANVGTVCTITPVTQLPQITHPVVIDGYTQPGATPNSSPIPDNAVILVELQGPAGGGSASGLRLSSGSDGSTIRGLVINRFPSAAVLISGSANQTVEGCFLGTDVTGLAAHANAFGINVTTAPSGTIRNHIGGPAPGQRNVISGNSGIGISAVGGQIIQGNYIGIDKNGTLPIMAPPSAVGITLSNVSTPGSQIGGTQQGAGNVISGFQTEGINVQNDENVFEGNFIGTDASGTHPVGNRIGINVTNQGNQTIGGPTAASRNIISGNSVDGISINAADNCTIQSNYIGTDVTGTVAIGNGTPNFPYGGIAISNGVQNTTIGGFTSVPGTPPGNLISGNIDYGIYSGGTTSSAGTVIQGNLIGAKADGTSPLPNGKSGIRLGEPGITVGGADAQGHAIPELRNVICANNGNNPNDAGITIFTGGQTIIGNYIGTDISGSGQLGNFGHGIYVSGNGSLISQNLIAFNGGNGVNVVSGTGNQIAMNSIHVNALGIDLGGNGVTLNDTQPGDPDNGPNNLQNFPVLVSARHIDNRLYIHGTLNSTRSTSPFYLEFFGNNLAHPSGYGEGQYFLGSIGGTGTTLGTDANGDLTFDADFPYVEGTHVVSATATDPNGNTSEFAHGISVDELPTVVSQKTHGNNATFSIPMPLSGLSGVEDRTGDGGVAGNHTIVLTYTSTPTGVIATVTAHNPPNGTGNVSNVSVSGNNLIVSLSNVSDRQVLTLSTSGGSVPAVTVPIGFLIGDSNGNRTVNSSDVLQTQSRSGMTVDGGTFRSDIDHNGVINSNDVSRIRANDGGGIP